MRTAMTVLVVDDEQPVLDELAYLLAHDDRIGDIHTATSALEAVAVLERTTVDGAFLDIAMPGVSGLELAAVIRDRPHPPSVVFVTAHDDHAVDAFELGVVDYLLKPVRTSRLDEAVRRLAEARRDALDDDVTVAVELGGVTRWVRRADIGWVEAQGDYARLHTADGTHLLRSPLSTLAAEWAEAGFVRIHRSLLVSTSHVEAVRSAGGQTSVVVRLGDTSTELGVARRHARELRDLVRLRAETPPEREDRRA